MKPIIIDGKEYYYEVLPGIYSDEYDCDITTFNIKERVTRKKYYLFGKKIQVDEYSEVFRIFLNIESPHFSKEYTKKEIDKQIAILKRAEEIKRGEIL